MKDDNLKQLSFCFEFDQNNQNGGYYRAIGKQIQNLG